MVTGPDGASTYIRMSPAAEPDRFHAVFRPDLTGYWSLRIEGWSDPATTWRSAVQKKLAAGRCEVICFDPNEDGLPADLPVWQVMAAKAPWNTT